MSNECEHVAECMGNPYCDPACEAVKGGEKIDATKCVECGNPHYLHEFEAGTEREIQRLCIPCFEYANAPDPVVNVMNFKGRCIKCGKTINDKRTVCCRCEDADTPAEAVTADADRECLREAYYALQAPDDGWVRAEQIIAKRVAEAVEKERERLEQHHDKCAQDYVHKTERVIKRQRNQLKAEQERYQGMLDDLQLQVEKEREQVKHEMVNQYIEHIHDKSIELDQEREHSAMLAAILIDCEQKWGCECPYCDRNYGDSFEEHATEDNGGGFTCKVGAALKANEERH